MTESVSKPSLETIDQAVTDKDDKHPMSEDKKASDKKIAPKKNTQKDAAKSQRSGNFIPISLSLILGAALVTNDYWRPELNRVIYPILGTPESLISLDEITVLQMQIQNVSAAQSDIQQHLAFMTEQVQNADSETKDGLSKVTDNAQSVTSLQDSLEQAQKSLAEQQIQIETLQQTVQNARPKQQSLTVSPELQSSVVRMNVDIKAVQQKLSNIDIQQQQANIQIADLGYFLKIHQSFSALSDKVFAAESFTAELHKFRLTLRDADKGDLFVPVETLSRYAVTGIVRQDDWINAVQQTLFTYKIPVIQQENQNVTDSGMMDQVWHEVKGLVKVSRIQSYQMDQPSLEEGLSQLDRLLTDGNDPQNNLAKLRQQGRAHAEVLQALLDIRASLEAKQGA